jgi:restriction endonuclease S subunit
MELTPAKPYGDLPHQVETTLGPSRARAAQDAVANPWPSKKFAEIAQFRNGLNFVKSDNGDRIKIVGVADFQRNFRVSYGQLDTVQIAGMLSSDDLLKDGDLLFVRSNGNKALIGRCILIDRLNEPISHSGFTIRARITDSTVLPEFVGLYFQSSMARAQIHNSGEGSHISNLSQGVLASLELPLPSIAEQEAIAEALSDADAYIESLEQLIAKKRRIKQGAMQELLTGKRRLPGFEVQPGCKTTEVGVIPEDWVIRPILSAVQIANGQVDPKEEPYRSMILVAPDHIEGCTGRLMKKVTAQEQGAISGKYIFDREDIVYSKIRPYLRKAFLADFEGLCSADMYPMRPAPDVSPGFVFALILGNHFSKYAESVSVRSGMPKINRVELSDYSFALPPTKTEQEAISAVLSDMDAEITALETKLAKARDIKQGMMQELLTGRVRLV